MSRLSWDDSAEKTYHTGIDRGVLYLSDGGAVPWNGLTSVEESLDTVDATSLYYGGVKYANKVDKGDFEATLTALTYPDEFDQYVGFEMLVQGFEVDSQSLKPFGLSYRTMIGNGIEGTDHGYQIHLMYNLIALVSDSTYESLSDDASPVEFGWDLSGVPIRYDGFAPTAHIIFDSTVLNPEYLSKIEDLLYGTDSTDPSLPTIEHAIGVFAQGHITITDNGDGSWSATGPEEFVVDNGDGSFSIRGANASFIAPDTYTISSN